MISAVIVTFLFLNESRFSCSSDHMTCGQRSCKPREAHKYTFDSVFRGCLMCEHAAGRLLVILMHL